MANASRRTEEVQQKTESFGVVEGLVIYHNTPCAEVGPPQVGQAWALAAAVSLRACLLMPPSEGKSTHICQSLAKFMKLNPRETPRESQHPPTSSCPWACATSMEHMTASTRWGSSSTHGLWCRCRYVIPATVTGRGLLCSTAVAGVFPWLPWACEGHF